MAVRPTVTVVIPTFNRRALLARAIQSVVQQTFTDFELIVVDDGSSDRVGEVLAEWPTADARLIVHPTHQGAAAARNTGIRAARGELIAFLDDDDQWLPSKLAQQIACFRSAPTGTGAVYCGYVLVSDRSGRTDRAYVPRNPPAGYVDFLTSTLFGSSIPLLARFCFDTVGPFDEALPGTHDRDMWLRIARRFDFALVTDILAQCHIHGRQITTDLAAKIVAKERMLEKYRSDLEQHPPILAADLTRLGMMHFAAGHPARGREYLERALDWGASRKEFDRHLTLSTEAPDAHRNLIARTAFRKLDGYTLY